MVFVFVYAFVFVLDKIAHDGTATQGEGWSGVALGGACQSQHLMDLLLCTDRTLQWLAVLSVDTVFCGLQKSYNQRKGDLIREAIHKEKCSFF